MVKQRCKNSVNNVHTPPEADADPDHNLVIIKLDPRLKTIRRRMKEKQWNRESIEYKGGTAGFKTGQQCKKHRALQEQQRQNGKTKKKNEQRR